MQLISKLLRKIKEFIISGICIGKDVFYINSYDSLPAPLSSEEEALYTSLLACDDSDAAQMLIKHNLRLVVYIARKFELCKTPLEDLISIGSIGLIKAVNTFDAEKKIKLATYASKCIENEILMHIRKSGKLKNEVSLDEPLTTDREGNELVLSDIIGESEDTVTQNLEHQSEIAAVIKCVTNLPEMEKMIITMRYGLNGKKRRTQKQIADAMCISQSYISRLEKKIVDELKRECEKMV